MKAPNFYTTTASPALSSSEHYLRTPSPLCPDNGKRLGIKFMIMIISVFPGGRGWEYFVGSSALPSSASRPSHPSSSLMSRFVFQMVRNLPTFLSLSSRTLFNLSLSSNRANWNLERVESRPFCWTFLSYSWDRWDFLRSYDVIICPGHFNKEPVGLGALFLFPLKTG